MTPDKQDALNELPWLKDAGERLEGLLGFTVIASPQGPMGPKFLGTLTSWEIHDSERILAWVDTVDEGPMDCWSYDVHDARVPLR